MASADRDALHALYLATGGESWKTKANWNTDADVSKWHGVEVNDQGRVVNLELSGNNLTGIMKCTLLGVEGVVVTRTA